MQEKNLKIFKYVPIFGTVFKIVCSVLIIIYSQKAAEELLKQNNYRTFIKNGARFKTDRHMSEKELKEKFEKISATFLLVAGIVDCKLKKNNHQ
jgi:anaerobic C4-dicarboxylate transporter